MNVERHRHPVRDRSDLPAPQIFLAFPQVDRRRVGRTADRHRLHPKRDRHRCRRRRYDAEFAAPPREAIEPSHGISFGRGANALKLGMGAVNDDQSGEPFAEITRGFPDAGELSRIRSGQRRVPKERYGEGQT